MSEATKTAMLLALLQVEDAISRKLADNEMDIIIIEINRWLKARAADTTVH
ncbi:hypothetical protein NKI12_08095 [Mesorhizobium australicum]|uniref:Uncharacterized protein n=1 Tax=Mesorhizobium australicum TaxID=536018 RepID=A0ACC6STZ6_9HYPH